MKITLQQLITTVTKSLAPLYLISGDEPLLIQEAIDAIQHAAEQAGYTERLRIAIENGTEWGKMLYANAHSLSLFSSKRILELDLTEAKLLAANTKLLQDYAEHPVVDSILLIKTPKLDSKIEKSAWYKAIEQAGMIVTIWPINREQLPSWIMQRAKKADLKITPAAAETLANKIEGNLLAAAQEIEKLRLLQSTQAIDCSVIEESVSDNHHFDIFILVDSILAADHTRSLRILHSLLAEGTEPILILWAMTRELRLMAELLENTKQGTALPALFAKFRIWEKRQNNVRAFLKRTTLDKCWALLSQAALIDRIIKGAENGNVKIELEKFIIQM